MICVIDDLKFDLSKPIDISIPLKNSENPIAWYLEQPIIEPVVFGDWIGKVSEGRTTNFNNIHFNPHGHGTHTECLGHITSDFYSINQCLKQFFFKATLLTVTPQKVGEDYIIQKEQLENKLSPNAQALIIRTLPNNIEKLSKNYSHSNPPFIDEEATKYLVKNNIKHLLIDLPSVDKEKDDGKLLSHKAFWNVKDVENLNTDARFDCTITEMIYVPDHVQDGLYLLNLQIASFENDATPSKPVLYPVY